MGDVENAACQLPLPTGILKSKALLLRPLTPPKKIPARIRIRAQTTASGQETGSSENIAAMTSIDTHQPGRPATLNKSENEIAWNLQPRQSRHGRGKSGTRRMPDIRNPPSLFVPETTHGRRQSKVDGRSAGETTDALPNATEIASNPFFAFQHALSA